MSTPPAPTSARKKTALYGGAFDPFHNGHLATIAMLLNSGEVDEVIVVPSGDRPDKPSVTAALTRLELCQEGVQEAFAGDSRVFVSDLQVSGHVDYGTIDLVRHFAVDTSREVLVVIGRELLSGLPSWKESDVLKKVARFLVIDRPGTLSVALMPEGWSGVFFKAPYGAGIDVSSTLLRELLGKKLSCAGLIPARVEHLCRERKLYYNS